MLSNFWFPGGTSALDGVDRDRDNYDIIMHRASKFPANSLTISSYTVVLQFNHESLISFRSVYIVLHREVKDVLHLVSKYGKQF